MRPSVILALAVTVFSCAPGNSPIVVTGIFTVDNACSVNDNFIIEQGLLDASGAGKYFVDLRITSDVIPYETLDNQGRLLSSPGAGIFTAEEIVLSYTSRNPVVAFESER